MKVPRLIVKLFAMYKIAADSRGTARDGRGGVSSLVAARGEVPRDGRQLDEIKRAFPPGTQEGNKGDGVTASTSRVLYSSEFRTKEGNRISAHLSEVTAE